MRAKIEARRTFSKDIKTEVLEKTEGRCAHCGKKLNENTFTIDHVIPLGKGGTNEPINLVPLCEKCNYEKNDLVMIPSEYYKYLPDHIISALNSLFNIYCEDVSWISTKNFTKEDKTVFPIVLESGVLNGFKKKNGKINQFVRQKTILEKAPFSDLDKIYDFLIRYHKRFALDTSELKNLLEYVFQIGCVYTLKKGEEIIAVFPISVDKCNYTDKDVYLLRYYGLPTSHGKHDYSTLIIRCLDYINGNIAFATGDDIVVFQACLPKEDIVIKRVIANYAQCSYIDFDDLDEQWYGITVSTCYARHNGDESKVELTMDEMITKFSKATTRLFKLKPIKEKTDNEMEKLLRKKNTKKSMKKERKRAERDMIDEYDERFYKN